MVLFLVDGLSVQALQTAFRQRRMPETRRFFLRENSNFSLGRAAFPSLTYPNIASILTASPVGEQPVLSNHMLLPGGKVVSFESAKFQPFLRATIDPISVIAELDREGRETASFSYVFGLNADSHMRVGITEGLEYTRHDYQDLDDRLLSNLEALLMERGDARNWPEFIYVHLVGVDGVSHRFGPQSREALAYLSWLDTRMKTVLRTLAAAEKNRHSIVSLLTSDHGFVATKRHVSLGKLLNKSDLGLVVTNESRFLGLFLPARRATRELEPVLSAARAVRGVEFTAIRNGAVLEIANGKSRFRFAIGPAVCAGEPVSLAPQDGALPPASASYRCPSDFDDIHSKHPFLIADLARFLTAPNHPDAIVVAQTDVAFTGKDKGGHGGLTAEEMFVPILLRNAKLAGSGPARTSSLLKILRNPMERSAEDLAAEHGKHEEKSERAESKRAVAEPDMPGAQARR